MAALRSSIAGASTIVRRGGPRLAAVDALAEHHLARGRVHVLGPLPPHAQQLDRWASCRSKAKRDKCRCRSLRRANFSPHALQPAIGGHIPIDDCRRQ